MFSFVPSARRLEKYQQNAQNATRQKEQERVTPSPPAAPKATPPPPLPPISIPTLPVAVVNAAGPSGSGLPGSPRRLLLFNRGGIGESGPIVSSAGPTVLVAATLQTCSLSEIERELDTLLSVFEAKFISEQEYEARKQQLLELRKDEEEDLLLRASSSATASGDVSSLEREVDRFLNGLEALSSRASASREEDMDISSLFILDGRQQSGVTPSGTQSPSVSVSSQRIAKPREVRVFLSSTFRDMQAERDWLVKTAFPQLRRMCAERGVFFAEVDLRWGITPDQAESGDTLNLCLSEIDRCRPYFINITKDRYGWVPNAVRPEVLRKFPWLGRFFQNDSDRKSVTELEVWHAALNNQSATPKASTLFYAANKKNHVKLSMDEEDNPEKLAQLRKTIQNAGFEIRYYDTPSDLAEMIVRDLTKSINADFPAGSKLDKHEQEAALHQAFAGKKSKLYLGRSNYFKSLNDFINSTPTLGPFVVHGEEGSGKSSLLANYFLQKRPAANELVFTHYLSASSESADYRSIMSRVMYTMKKEFKIDDEIDSTNADKLSRDFRRWLQFNVPVGRKFVLVLDGLDELAAIELSQTLNWIPLGPGSLPRDGRVRIIISTRTGSRTHEIVKKEAPNHSSLELKPLGARERTQLAKEFMALYGKNLTESQLRQLTDRAISSHTSNPLFLHLVLEELRIFGVFEEIDRQVAFYLRSRSISELYERVLDRLEKDYGTQIVRDVFCLLLVARRGLSDTELLGILDIPRLELSPLLLGASELFVCFNGLLTLGHDSLKKAVERRYLDSHELKRKYHLDIADYFEAQLEATNDQGVPEGDITRQAEELPNHLLVSEHWYRLLLVVSKIPIFLQLAVRDTIYELKRYWISLERKGYNPTTHYVQALADYEAISKDVLTLARTNLKVAKFLRTSFHYEGARDLLHRVLDLLNRAPRNGASLPQISKLQFKAYYVMAQSFWNQGNWKDAESWALKALESQENASGASNNLWLAKCLCGLGEVYLGLEDMEKARTTLQRALNMFDSLLGAGSNHWSTRVMHDLAAVANYEADWDIAIHLHREAIRIRERVLGEQHPQLAVSWETYGATLKLADRIQEAETAFRKALELNEIIHGVSSVNVAGCCAWLVVVLRDQNRHGDADVLEQRANQIHQTLADRGVAASAVERTID